MNKLIRVTDKDTHECAGGKCPTIYKTEDGDFIVQGYILDSSLSSEINFSDNETAVRIPKSLIEELVNKL